MQIDIRNEEARSIDSIIFANAAFNGAYELYLAGCNSEIRSKEFYVNICSRKDAENLIEALQKAIELENWE